MCEQSKRSVSVVLYPVVVVVVVVAVVVCANAGRWS